MRLFSPIKKILLTTLLYTTITSTLLAQPIEIKYRSPLDREISLSANFAEIRAGHFHSGLDLRVGGVAGAKLYAVADGYITRIFVSPFGYGKAIYINHPNGETSVYGHLDRFSNKINKYIEKIQYDTQSFRLDEGINDPEVLPVKKGEVIGYAGNSGSSFGAHLHFEIRNTHNQNPTNVVKRGIINISDDVPPTIHNVAIFTLDNSFAISTTRLLKSAKVVKKGNVWVPEGDDVFEVYNPAYIGVCANDYLPNNRSKFGIYNTKAYIDNNLFYSYTLDEFSFDETRYINSFIDYGELVKNDLSYVKTYIEEGNKLSVYNTVKNNGLIVLNDTLQHNIRIELYDAHKNKTTLAFKIKKAKKPNPNNTNLLDTEKFRPMLWDMPFTYERENLKIVLAKESLYSNAIFYADSSEMAKDFYSPIWTIGNENIPLHKQMTISLRANVPEKFKQQAVIVKIGKNNKLSSVGGKWDENNNGFISANVSDFGTYSVVIDSIAPTIKVAFKKAADLRKQNSLKVTIADNLSGIDTYNGYIDGKWALFDYDAKNNALIYKFDANRIKKGIQHKLKVVVVDACKNTQTFETEFLW